MRKWLRISGVILLVLSLPVLLPYGIVSHAIFRCRLKRAAERSVCQTCGSKLGKEALKLADRQLRENVDCFHRLHPGLRLRMVRLVDAVCLTCGTSLRFIEDTQLFEITTTIPRLFEDVHDH